MAVQVTTPRPQGVKIIELYKIVWSKWDKIALVCGLILFSWARGFAGFISLSLLQNATTIFAKTNLISVLSTVLYILQTVLYPMYSKLSDMYGRAQCYTVATIFYMLSFIVMACANNYETLVGGRIIYAFGIAGISILGPITIADITNAADRGILQALYNVPTLINIFVASKAGEQMYATGNWRWGYGMVPFIVLVTCMPLIITLWKLFFQVKKSGLLDDYRAEQKRIQEEENLDLLQKTVWFVEEIDIIGSFLLVAGLSLILLPLVLAESTWGGWQSSTTIGILVSGVVAWALFSVWEWKFARKPVIPLAKWDNRTPVLGVCALSTYTFISFTNFQYFTTYLRVSRKISTFDAQMLERSYNVAYYLCEIVAGLLMKRFRVWKPFVWTGIGLIILGVGLMIPARLPASSDAFIVITQIVVGTGSGLLYLPMLVAVQSSVPHDDMAIATAMIQTGASVAASIGTTMAGSIWNNMLPVELAKRVIGEYDYAQVAGNVTHVINLPDEQYHSVVDAFGHCQMVLSITAMCISVLIFCFTYPMKCLVLEDDYENKDMNDNLIVGENIGSHKVNENYCTMNQDDKPSKQVEEKV